MSCRPARPAEVSGGTALCQNKRAVKTVVDDRRRRRMRKEGWRRVPGWIARSGAGDVVVEGKATARVRRPTVAISADLPAPKSPGPSVSRSTHSVNDHTNYTV